MFSSVWLLRVKSHDISQAEKERTGCKASKFTKCQPLKRRPLWVKIVVSLWNCSALQAVLSFSAWEISCDSTCNSQKLEDM